MLDERNIKFSEVLLIILMQIIKRELVANMNDLRYFDCKYKVKQNSGNLLFYSDYGFLYQINY